MVEKRQALGKGLSALIPDVPEPKPTSLDVDIDRLDPNSFQPRNHFDAAGIQELAQSIKANGIIQPIIVRRAGSRFQIIAGERRWRAAQHAGLLKVPVIVRDIEPGQEEKLLEIALVENLQRENLDPIEEALAYKRLADEFDLTQERIADIVGKDRATVANTIRLLRLPQSVREHITSQALTMGHARALLALDNEALVTKAAALVLDKRLTVRQTEKLVQQMRAPAPTRPQKKADVHTRAAEEQLRLSLGTQVRIVRQRRGGRIEIDFKHEDDLQRLYEHLTGK